MQKGLERFIDIEHKPHFPAYGYHKFSIIADHKVRIWLILAASHASQIIYIAHSHFDLIGRYYCIADVFLLKSCIFCKCFLLQFME